MGIFDKLNSLVRTANDFDDAIGRQPQANRGGQEARERLGRGHSRVRRAQEDEVLRLKRSGVALEEISAHLDATDPYRNGR